MSFILIERIADFLAKETGKPKEILKYSLIILWNSIAGYAVLIMGAWFFGWVEVAFITAITYSSFKIFMGGPHASSNFRCIIMGTIVFNSLAYISLLIQEQFITHLTFICISLLTLSIGLYAPADVAEKPIIDKKQKGNLKLACYLLLILWGVIILFLRDSVASTLVIASCLGLLWQGISITPLGYRIVGFLDIGLGGGRK